MDEEIKKISNRDYFTWLVKSLLIVIVLIILIAIINPPSDESNLPSDDSSSCLLDDPSFEELNVDICYELSYKHEKTYYNRSLNYRGLLIKVNKMATFNKYFYNGNFSLREIDCTGNEE